MISPNRIAAKREAELKAGRARFEERAKHDPTVKDADVTRLIKEADKRLKEDEQRRDELLSTTSYKDRVDADRAQAEIIDQTQTELEGLQHIADRNETILTREREHMIERLEGDADPEAATEVTVDIVKAQAVNQPTVLANNKGVDTESKPLNASGLEDGRLSDRLPTPADKHVPKTRKKAEKIADAKVPPASEVVHEDNKAEALKVVNKAPDEALGA